MRRILFTAVLLGLLLIPQTVSAKKSPMERNAMEYAELRCPFKDTTLRQFVSIDITYKKSAKREWRIKKDVRRCIKSIQYVFDSDNFDTFNATQSLPVDASICRINGTWQIKQEVPGSRVDVTELREAMAALVHISDLREYAILPNVTAKDLQPKLSQISNACTWFVVYSNGKKIKLNESWFDDKGNLDTVRLREKLDKVLLSYYTVGKGTTFKPTGYKKKTIKVKGGTWGSDVNNDAEFEYILDAIDKGEPLLDREPIFYRKQDKIGKNYIEVSLQRQHLWIYRKGKLVLHTAVTTGLPTPERHTPKGVWYISEKIPGKYLKGDDYKTWVNWWMRLNNDGVGLHDAYWKWQFGGDLYKSVGSHGCINLPKEIAPKVYKLSKVFMPVVIY